MKRSSHAVWKGDLKSGSGTMKVGADLFSGQYSFASRFESGTGTNPEELIAAAHAGCFSMAFSAELSGAGHTPEEVATTAAVSLEKQGDGFAITGVHLTAKAKVPGIKDDEFQKIAQAAKEGCPVSRALKAITITVEATLV